MEKKKFAVLLMPYFGKWPPWFPAYLESCRWNPDFHFIFFTDCGIPDLDMPSNVKIVFMRLEDFSEISREAFPFLRRIKFAYKVCDYRPILGKIFNSEITEYEFFGWGDIDVIYGDLRGHLEPWMLKQDLISFNKEHLSGHLTLVKTEIAEDLPFKFPNWKSLISSENYENLDEPPPSALEGLQVCAIESYNTPLSPLKPWTNGAFIFPKKWFWYKGRLTNDLDGPRLFSHLHFMHWKGGAWPRECGNAQWESLPEVYHLTGSDVSEGFAVTDKGFFPLGLGP